VGLPFQTLKNEMTKLCGRQVSEATVIEMKKHLDEILEGSCHEATIRTIDARKKRVSVVTMKSVLSVMGVTDVAIRFRELRRCRKKT